MLTLALEKQLNISEAVKKSASDTNSGVVADINAKVLLSTSIVNDSPFQPVELKDNDCLLIMMRDCDIPHIYGENNIFYFSAYYSHDDRYPVGRNYYIREKTLSGIAFLYGFFEKQGITLPVISPSKLLAHIKAGDYKLRIKHFYNRQSSEVAYFKGLFEGRKKSTTVEKSMFLNTCGCLVCGDDDFLIMTSTFSASKGYMVGYKLCERHMNLAREENNLIAYLAKIFKQPSPIYVSRIGAEEHVISVLASLPKELNSKVIKVSRNTITMVRASGFTIIFRLDSPTNYAYMVIDSEGNEVVRIDSADHHHVPYGPDHCHPKLKQDPRKVETSFTLGSPMIDLKKIKDMIEESENNS